MEPTINKKLLGIFAGVIFLFFTGFIIVNEYGLIVGKKVYLKTIPVDPRDLLRGDYVILSYEIEHTQKTKNFIKKNNLQKGDTVYFIINTDKEKLGTLKDISLTQPKSEILYIKGVYNNPQRWGTTPFNLGIGKFFVPQKVGKKIERRTEGIKVLVNINKYGTAKIIEIDNYEDFLQQDKQEKK